MSRDENGRDGGHTMMSCDKLKPESPACLGLSGDWDSLIEVVLETSREEFNLSG